MSEVERTTVHTLNAESNFVPNQNIFIFTSTDRIKTARVRRVDVINIDGTLCLVANTNIEKNEIVLIDDCIVKCNLDIPGMYETFLNLEPNQRKFMETCANSVESFSEPDWSEIDSYLKAIGNESILKDFAKFVSIMRCNGHATNESNMDWALFPIGLRANHSCDPNVTFRCVHDRLVYAALRPIKRGEQIFMSYIEPLYGSTIYRKNLTQKDKSFECQCSRCMTLADPCRTMLCPKCRNEKMDEDPRELPLAKMTEAGTWKCQICDTNFPSHLMPIIIETSLQSVFENLDSNFIKPSVDEWTSTLAYLIETALSVLGPKHWITNGGRYLLSRYYLGVYIGGHAKSHISAGAYSQADAFFEFCEESSEAAVRINAASWSSAIIRLTLLEGNVDNFNKYYTKFTPYLKGLFGLWDHVVNVYESADAYIKSVQPDAVSKEKLHEFGISSRRTQYVKPPASSAPVVRNPEANAYPTNAATNEPTAGAPYGKTSSQQGSVSGGNVMTEQRSVLRNQHALSRNASTKSANVLTQSKQGATQFIEPSNRRQIIEQITREAETQAAHSITLPVKKSNDISSETPRNGKVVQQNRQKHHSISHNELEHHKQHHQYHQQQQLYHQQLQVHHVQQQQVHKKKAQYHYQCCQELLQHEHNTGNRQAPTDKIEAVVTIPHQPRGTKMQTNANDSQKTTHAPQNFYNYAVRISPGENITMHSQHSSALQVKAKSTQQSPRTGPNFSPSNTIRIQGSRGTEIYTYDPSTVRPVNGHSPRVNGATTTRPLMNDQMQVAYLGHLNPKSHRV